MNNSSAESGNCSQTIETPISSALKTLVLILIGGFGIFGNIFIIVLALKYTVRKNLHHLIINMAIADTVVVLTTFGLDIPVIVDHQAWANVRKYGGNGLCKMLAFLIAAGMWQTLVSLFMISLERFRATKLTVHRSQSYSSRQRVAAIIGCWLIAIALASHELYQTTIINYPNSIYHCNYFDAYASVWNIVLISISTPTIFTIFVLGFITLRRLSSGHMNLVNLPEPQRKARKKRMVNGIKLVFTSLFLYMGCYLPRYIGTMLHVIDDSTESALNNVCIDYNVYDYMLTCLPLVNSCFSPCIYLIFLSDFRKAAKKLIYRRTQPIKIRRNSVHNHQVTQGIEERMSIELREKETAETPDFNIRRRYTR